MKNRKCPVCSTPVKETGSRGGADIYDYDCPVCGTYSLTRKAKYNLRSAVTEERRSAVISHAIRRMQKQNSWPVVNPNTLDTILDNDRLPSPAEQGDNLVLWLGQITKTPGQPIELNPTEQRAIIGATNNKNFLFIVEYLLKKGLVSSEGGNNIVTLSLEGWNKCDDLRRGAVESRKAFMAMPFGNDVIDRVFREYFKKAVREAGFDLTRLDEKPTAGSIDDRLRVEILTSRFLIAELTDGNHGAYWEAGFAEGLGKPVIYTCEKSYFQKRGTHFDTNHLHTVMWEAHDLDSAAEKLKTTIRATLPEDAKLVDD